MVLTRVCEYLATMVTLIHEGSVSTRQNPHLAPEPTEGSVDACDLFTSAVPQYKMPCKEACVNFSKLVKQV